MNKLIVTIIVIKKTDHILRKKLNGCFFILVPSESPVILDVNGYEVGATVGPYNEGDTLQLSCTVKGGNLDIPRIDFKRLLD